MLNRIPEPKAAIMKPKELSVNPRFTVKKVWPKINSAPAAKRLNEIEELAEKTKQEGAKVTYYNEDWNVVVWEDSRHNDFLANVGIFSGTIDIYAQFIDADGNERQAGLVEGDNQTSI